MISSTGIIAAANCGPITLDVQLDSGTIHVTVEDRERAEVTVTGAERVDHTETGGTLRVRPVCPSGAIVSGNGIVVQGGRGVSIVNAGRGVVITGSHHGSITVGNGCTQINTFGGGNVSSVTVGGEGVRVEARLPIGSSLAAHGTNVNIDATGQLATAQASTTNGSIDLDGVNGLDASSTNGSIRVSRYRGRGTARTTNGSIAIHAVGDGQIRATSSNGGITITRDQGVDLDTDASSTNGRTRIR